MKFLENGSRPQPPTSHPAAKYFLSHAQTHTRRHTSTHTHMHVHWTKTARHQTHFSALTHTHTRIAVTNDMLTRPRPRHPTKTLSVSLSLILSLCLSKMLSLFLSLLLSLSLSHTHTHTRTGVTNGAFTRPRPRQPTTKREPQHRTQIVRARICQKCFCGFVERVCCEFFFSIFFLLVCVCGT